MNILKTWLRMMINPIRAYVIAESITRAKKISIIP